MSAAQGYADTARYLIEKGAEPNVENRRESKRAVICFLFGMFEIIA